MGEGTRGIGAVDLSALIGAIYDAAIAPEKWSDFLLLFSQACRSTAATMFVHDFSVLPGSSSGSFLLQQGFDPDCVLTYADHFGAVNPWLKDEARFPAGAVVQSGELYPDKGLPKTEWYSDWLRPQDLFYAIGSTLVRSASSSVNLTLLRSKSAGEYSGADRELVGLLVPHLQRALAIHKQYWQVSMNQAAATNVLDRLPHGVAFLTPEGRVLYMNRAAEAILRAGDGLFLDAKGVVDAKVAAERTELRALIGTTAQLQVGTGRNSGHMQISRRRGAKLAVQVAPLPRELPGDIGLLGILPFAVMTISDPDVGVRSSTDQLRGLYGLTPAESRLAMALVSGLTLQEYAGANGVTRNTAATQLRAVMTKLGARRQSDVVRIILSGLAANQE